MRKLLLVHSNPDRVCKLKPELHDAGWRVTVGDEHAGNLEQQYWEAGPEVVVVGLSNGAESALDFAVKVLGWKAAPVVFLEEDQVLSELARGLDAGGTFTTSEDLLAALIEAVPGPGVVNLHGFSEGVSGSWRELLNELVGVLVPHGWGMKEEPGGHGSAESPRCLDVVNLSFFTPHDAAAAIARTLRSKYLRDHDYLFLHNNPGAVHTQLEGALSSGGARRYANWNYQIAVGSELVERTLRFVTRHSAPD